MGKIEEETMSLCINESGEKESVWHTWSGLR